MISIGVIGFGKIGQAVVAFILRSGIPVIAFDINPDIKASFDRQQYTTNESGLSEILIPAYNDGSLSISSDFSKIQNLDAIIITIPLMVNQQKQLSDKPFVDCVKQLAPYLESNKVIIIETSVPLGYGRNVVAPAIESCGKKHGKDFLLAHSPERIKSGTMMEQLVTIPKIIGGLNDEAAEKAMELYGKFFPEGLLKRVESIEAAEMAKLAGMIYRDVNIALSNQFAQLADFNGIHFADLISLINTDNEANLLQPGIGVGGHCTPVYPYFMIENFRKAGLEFTIASESRTINDGMAVYAVSRIKDKIENKKALLLGLGFRPNVKEDSFSTTYLVNDALIKAGFSVKVHDTEYSKQEIENRNLFPADDIYSSGAEVVFLITMHQGYADINFKRLKDSGVRWLVDGRNAFKKVQVEEAGINYLGIGR